MPVAYYSLIACSLVVTRSRDSIGPTLSSYIVSNKSENKWQCPKAFATPAGTVEKSSPAKVHNSCSVSCRNQTLTFRSILRSQLDSVRVTSKVSRTTICRRQRQLRFDCFRMILLTETCQKLQLEVDGRKSVGYPNSRLATSALSSCGAPATVAFPAVTTCFVTPSFWPTSETTWPIIVTIVIFFECLRADSARWPPFFFLHLPR